MLVQDLATRFVQNVMYEPKMREAVQASMVAWRDQFCPLPVELKKQFGYQPDQKLSGTGYELHLDPAKDLKEVLHLNLEQLQFLEGEAKKLGKDAYHFVVTALDLIELVMPLAVEFAEAVEQYYEIPGLAQDVLQGIKVTMLRFLHYFPRSDRIELARMHTDKGGFTLHLYESHPGLQYYNAEGEWVDMVFSEKETAILPGIRLQHRTRCKLTAAWHRVVATEATKVEDRYSAVCFTEISGARYFDKKRFGPQQDMPLKWNYGICFDDLNFYFTD